MVKIRRKTKLENRYHPKMGVLRTPVTKVTKTVLGIPVQTLHTYRETYHGKIKDCEVCEESSI